MGLEKHEKFIKKSKSALVFEPGWSEDNLTGAWRAERPRSTKRSAPTAIYAGLFVRTLVSKEKTTR